MDYEWLSPSRFGIMGHPVYKPEFWDKIQELDQWTNKYDPVMTCQPLGLPRHGTPRRIIQTDKDVIFFYGANADYGGGTTEFRDIPTDGRQRNARTENLATYYGNSIGTWQGDTLVIDSTSISSIRRGWDEGASSTPAACTSSRNSPVLAMKSATT